jgi:hypothetical protein
MLPDNATEKNVPANLKAKLPLSASKAWASLDIQEARKLHG